MQYKLLIDVDDQGTPMITIEKPYVYNNDVNPDVRDKLVKRFIEGGMFASISWVGDNCHIISMGANDVLSNIMDILGPVCNTSEQKEDFRRHLSGAAHIINDICITVIPDNLK